jgi:hypothetical protein
MAAQEMIIINEKRDPTEAFLKAGVFLKGLRYFIF